MKRILKWYPILTRTGLTQWMAISSEYTPLAYMHTHLLADSKNKAFKYKSSEKNQTQKQNEREIETKRMDGWMNRGRVSRQKRSENTRRNETNLLIHPYYYDCFYFHF